MNQQAEILRSKIRQGHHEMMAVTNKHGADSHQYRQIQKKLDDLETELQAELSADAAGRVFANDGESAEIRAISGRVRMGNYVRAVMSGHAPEGAELELNQAYEIADPDRFPLSLLDPASWSPQMAKTDADAGTRQSTWLDRLFADTAAMHVGVTFESVRPGIQSYPVTTAGAAAAQRGRTEKAADASWTIGVTELKPTRNAVRVVFSDEDMYRLPTLESALRRDLAMALTEGIDRTIFTGDADANENSADITGFTGITAAATGLVEKTLTQANKVKAPETLASFAGFIDGKHASSMSDLRVVASVGANTLWLSQIAAAAADTKTISQFLRENGLMWMTRGEIETATSNGKFGAIIGKSRGIAGAAMAPVWQSGRLIRDIYTKASSGECSLTLATMWNFGLVRPSNFARLKFVS